MVRARRRAPPAALLLPCRGIRAPADSWGRWRFSRDAPGSAPPPRSSTLWPTSGGYWTARGGGGGGAGRSGVTASGWLASPVQPGSPASNARREAPPRPRPFALGLGWWAAPTRSPRVPAHCPAGSASPQAPSGPAWSWQPRSVGQSPAGKLWGAGRMLITPSWDPERETLARSPSWVLCWRPLVRGSLSRNVLAYEP